MNFDLHLGDCLELLHGMCDQNIDVVVTDVPYGIGENNAKNLSRSNAVLGQSWCITSRATGGTGVDSASNGFVIVRCNRRIMNR
jgi:DNA modification methylase